MRILVVSELFWPEGGGAEYATYLIIRILCNLGYKIKVVTGTKGPSPIYGVKFYYTPILRDVDRIKRFTYIKLLSSFNWFKRLLMWSDVLYIPLMAYPLLPVAKKLGKNVIVHVHNLTPIFYQGVKYYDEPFHNDIVNDFKYGIRHEYYFRKSIRRTILMPISYYLYRISKTWLQEADVIIAVTKWLSMILHKVAKIPMNKIYVIYNPMPEIPNHVIKNANTKKGHKDYIIYIGGDSILKGFPVALFIALKLIQSNYKNYTFIFTGLSKNSLIKFSKLEQVYSSLLFFPRIPREQVLKLISWSKVLLFPSIIEEPAPYTVIEAVLLNCIPLAGKLGGIPEILGPLCEKFGIDYLDSGKIISEFLDKINKINALTSNEVYDILINVKNYIKRIMCPKRIMDHYRRIFD